jgi:putative ABC transport system permease protein
MAFEFIQSLRGILRNPGFALLSIVTLALGIGISTAVFSVVNGVLLQPLQFPQSERIISLNTRSPGRPTSGTRITGGDFADLRAQNQVFDAVSVYSGGEVGVQLRGHGEFTGVFWVNPEFFSIFGQKPGGFSTSSAVVAEAFAARNFGDSQRAVGQPIRVENRVYEITSVLKGARFPADAQVWLPAPYMPENLNRTAFNYRAVAKLRDGVSLEQAKANLDGIAAQLSSAFPKSNAGRTFEPVLLRKQLTGSVQSTLYLLLGAVLLVLLIACANVSNLLLARATIRSREIAVRTALGASRAAIVRMLVLESFTLAVLGGLLGTALAFWGTRAMLHFAPADLPRGQDIHLDYAVLAFAMALSLFSAMAFGVLPALQASRVDSSARGGFARGVLRGGSHRLRNCLVVAEIALSFVLATGAGLFFRSFLALNATDMGFQQERILVMYAHAPARELSQYVQVTHAFVDRLLPSLAGLPGVQGSAAVMGLPTGQYGSNGSYAVVGRLKSDGDKLPESNWALSSPNYFSTMHIPLLRGRDFTPRDQYDAPGVVIMSESAARQSFPGEDPVGRQLMCGLDAVTAKPMTIVGIAGDVRQDSPGSPPRPTLYMPMEQHPYHSNELQVIVRTAAAPGAMSSTIRKAAYDLNPEMAVKFTTMEEMISESIAAPRFRTFLAATFAMLALLVAMAGIYGVMSYVVTQRTQELGLRMALGAERGDVIGLVLWRAVALAAMGLALGAALSLAVSRLLGAMLFGLKATDPATYGLVVLAVGGIAILAAAGPAWRASSIDPMVALRQE